MEGLTTRTARRHVFRAAAGVTLTILATAACTAEPEPTLVDVGAMQLAGQGGDALEDRCGTLPAPEGTALVDCADGSGSSVADVRLDAGTYSIVLLCETSGTYTLRSEHPLDLFEDVLVDCPEGDDPVVRRAFDLDEATQMSLGSAPETSGASVAFLVRES
ncbi:hypothetical protein [Cellulomonas sp. S1-8]|uniref:hypothetical protein n=1 Tax=Cellulomonas sp. S1-8 TaxID=2904790 RepID=UPI0022445A0E|nr:hypothetical protein [Cellulomonas sp. S1-8]UZN03887.1 hypothetical protein OKX07_02800 [Cellulomonas sp. S1-8]